MRKSRSNKKHPWIIALPAIVLMAGSSHFYRRIARPSPEKLTRAAVEHTQRLINITHGERYFPQSFSGFSPVYSDAQEGTVIGYVINHIYSDIRRPGRGDLVHRRYHLSNTFNVVCLQSHWPEIGCPADEGNGLAAIRDAYEAPGE